ncbi:hypothetical protein ACFONC_10485 [Luteimonas soli]|uniref:Uncharacterized protein n=1 Tax=Luteimonas soli TaxID=1648966 RepID=A0ABV7XK94_9GAMM
MPRLLIIAILALSTMFPSMALATAQIPDRILIDGQDYALNTNPLTPRLVASGWLPPKEAMVSSANWRGYTASWEIADGKLVLRDATILVAGEEPGDYTPKSILGDLFPSAAAPVVADWYSGALIVPDGEMTHYVHMGYGSSYERYQVLRIVAGRVVEHVRLSADEFERYKADKFEAFTATEEYRKSLEELREQGDALSDEQLRNFMMSYYAEQYLSL